MSMQIAIYDALKAHAGLLALVSTRIYPDIAPASAVKPFVTWQEISVESANTTAGSADPRNARVQVSCWADDATESRDIETQVRAAMAASTQFRQTPLHLDTRSLGYEQDTKLYGMQADFSVWFSG